MHHGTEHAPETTGRVIHRARWYDLVGRKLSMGRNKLVQLAAPAPGEDALDVGCGTGTSAIALSPMVAPGEVHGFDASPEMIAVAKEKAAKSGLELDFQVALIEAIPFPDHRFDLVVSSLMLHHLPDDLKRRGFAEIRRVLRPGGRFLAMDLANESHSPIGHLVSIMGHTRGEAMVPKLAPMLSGAGFGRVESIVTRNDRFAFIRCT